MRAKRFWKTMNSIEIFSGAGGLAKGLELAGTNHQAFIEWNADACNTLRMNYDRDIIYHSINTNV